MKIYDISQEVLSCSVFPGDPSPKAEKLTCMEKGELYNLSAFSMCAHNGTHIDAPRHFIANGKSIDALALTHFIGGAYVAEHQGVLSADDAERIFCRARACGADCEKRILIKGKAEVSLEAAKLFSSKNILLLGNESQTVGPENAPRPVHLELLLANIALLEGVRLEQVPEGSYFLSAAPLNFGGFDGSPCRAVLIDASAR